MDSEALHDAVSRGDSWRLQRLLTRSSRSFADTIDLQTGWTPLGRAVICGHYNIVKILLRHGVDPNRKTAAGETPLHMAVDASQYRLCRVLLEHNADPNQRNDYGETPLHLAVARNDVSLASLLLIHNADFHLKDTLTGESPESLAQKEGHSALLDLFQSPPKPSTHTSSMISSRRSTNLSPSSRSRSTSAEHCNKSIQEHISDMQEISFNILAAMSTCESDQTQPSEPAVFTKSIGLRSTLTVEQEALREWLSGLQLQGLLDRLIDAGFNSVQSLLIIQSRLNLDFLSSLGISSFSERLLLLAALELEVKYASPSPLIPLLCCSPCLPAKSLQCMPALRDWLRRINLESECEAFLTAGFTSLEQLLALMHTRWAITDEVLEKCLNMRKLGHRHRILCQLLEDAKGVDPYALLLGSSGLRMKVRAPLPGLCALM